MSHPLRSAAGSWGATDTPVTLLLGRLSQGDRGALDGLLAGVYPELHRLAHLQRRRLAAPSTQCTTGLVHELYLKFAGSAKLDATSRHHFFCVAARALRQILIDEVRRRAAQRRPDPALACALEHADLAVLPRGAELLALDRGLERLARAEPALAQLVELRAFAGCTLEEIAERTERSLASLKRDWQKARLFLARELGASPP